MPAEPQQLGFEPRFSIDQLALEAYIALSFGAHVDPRP
jgi:hypothetical protein